MPVECVDVARQLTDVAAFFIFWLTLLGILFMLDVRRAAEREK